MDSWLVESDHNITEVRRATSSRQTIDRSSAKSSRVYVNVDGQDGEFFAQLAELRESGYMCDVVLVAVPTNESIDEMTEDEICSSSSATAKPNAKEITAHRLVLAASSQYFRGMFTSPMKEATSQRIIMKEIDGSALAAVIDYMYTGRLEIDESTVQNLLTVASLLQINNVREACSGYLLDQLDVSNCLGIAAFAHFHSCAQLAQAARIFTKQHFRDLVDCDELLSMTEDCFFALISDDMLTTKGEEFVYIAVMNWVKYDLPNRRQYLAKMLSAVRFPLLSKDFLFHRVHNDPMVKDSSECKDLLLEAYRYIINQEMTDDMSASWLRPREPIPVSQELIMMIGGQAPKALTDVCTFDPDSNRWSYLAPLSQRRCRCGVAFASDRVYAVGGFNGSARVRSVDVYNPETNTWSAGPAMDARRSTLGVTVADGVVYAIGGFDGATGLSSAEMLDPRVGHWAAIPSMTTRRSSVAVTALNGIVYAVGGYDGEQRECLKTVELFDTRAHRWLSGPSMSEVRSGAGVTVSNGRVIVAGGHHGPDVRFSAEAFLPNSDAWEKLPSMGQPRRNAAIMAVNGHVFALGGDNGTSNLTSIEVLNLEAVGSAYQWNTLEVEMPQAKSYAGVVLLPKK